MGGKPGKKIGMSPFLLAIVGMAPLVLAATAEGTWTLTEQYYAGGQSNLAVADRPVHLALTRGPQGWSGTLWAGDDRAAARAWPAFVTDAGPLPVEIAEREDDPSGGGVRVRYRVRPSETDDLVLDVTEDYRLSPDGTALEGTMRVDFTGGATNRGGYTLHRRFERAR